MEQEGVSVILPYLNENLSNLKRIIEVLKKFFNKNPYEIFIMDGGSNINNLKFIKKITQNDKNIFSFMDYPLILPNKNIGIYNASNVLKYNNVFILDCDNKSLSYKNLDSLKNNLKTFDIVIPNLNRKGGRSNRILGNPFLRLFFPEIHKTIPYPFPGIFGIKKELLKKITNNKNYCLDWGGESNLVIDGYYLSKGNVSSPIMIKEDKKRGLSSMVQDAFQINRNNFLLSVFYNKFPKDKKDIIKKINKDFEVHKDDFELLNRFINEHNINELRFITKRKFDKFMNFKGPFELVRFIDNLFKKYNLYEFYIINSLAVLPLINILFKKRIKLNFIEKSPKSVRILDLKRISILVDLVFAALLNIYLRDNTNPPYENIETMLKNKDNSYKSEFTSIKQKEIKEIIRNGIDINYLNKKDISHILQLKSIKNTIKRNKGIEEYYLGNKLIGSVDKKNISIDELGMVKERIKFDNDFFVKLSILTTIAGYLKKNKINLNDSQFQKRSLEKFLSYVLNNKKFAPMKYNLDIKFTEFKPIHKRYSHNYDCVILFSGGFDSTAAFLKALDEGLNPLLLWVGFGQKNEEIEYQKVKNISKKIKYPVSIVKINLGEYIEEGWKDWDYIIPARNFMFVCLAASFLSSSKKKKVKIYLSAHEEEIKKENTDKSREFFRGCNDLFSEFYNKGFKVGTPFEKYSKSEISAYWKNKWIKKYNISPYETTTCYYGNTCGRCKACLKRSISLLVGGFELDPDIKENPFEDKDGFISKDFLKRFNKFPLKRKVELIIALDKSLVSLPQEVQDKMLLLKSKYLKRINDFKKHLSEIKIK